MFKALFVLILAWPFAAFADEWFIESVDTAGWVGYHTSIALDTSDNPHISYSYKPHVYDIKLKYAYYDGSSWQIVTVDTAQRVGIYTSIALDAADNPHISYYDMANYDLKYAYYDGSSWQIESVDTEGPVGYCTSIALDASDNPCISYCGKPYWGSWNDNLKYAYYDGSSWHIESVDTEGFVGECTSIALDASDNPHISYLDHDNEDLKYAYYDGSSWQIESVDTEGQVGWFTSIALDAADNPHISYHDDGNNDLKYAWYGPDDVGITVKCFSVVGTADGVEVSWDCADPVSGFNLYRSTATGGIAITSRDKLNGELITGASPYSYLDAAVEEGTTYSYWLEAIDAGGASETFGPVECTWNGALPKTYALYQSRPNPASGNATIAFDLPEDTKVTLTVYDISGRKITTVVNETLTIGTHERTVPALAPGVYVYKLSAGTFSAAKKMVVQ